MRYMLDTDICVYAINGRAPQVIEAMEQHLSAGLGISAIAASELHFGVAKSGSRRNAEALRMFLAQLEVAPFDLGAAEVCGGVRTWLQAAGTPIGPLDTLIAAHACALDVTLVTNNTREFSRVPGLKLANWAAAGAA